MRKDPSSNGVETENIAERLIDHVSEAAERIGDAGHAIVERVQERVERVSSRFQREVSSLVGLPIPPDVRPVKPKKNSSTWLAWREDRWVPVHRVKDVGCVWSE